MIQKLSCIVVLLKLMKCDCVFPAAEEVETLSSCTRSSCRHASVEADIDLTQPAEEVGFICHQFSSELKRKLKVLAFSLFSLNQPWLNTPAPSNFQGFMSSYAKPAAYLKAFSDCLLTFSNNLSCVLVRIAAGQWIFTPNSL